MAFVSNDERLETLERDYATLKKNMDGLLRCSLEQMATMAMALTAIEEVQDVVRELDGGSAVVRPVSDEDKLRRLFKDFL